MMKEKAVLLGKSVKLGLMIKSPLSKTVSVLGFAMAFVPVLMSDTLGRLTNQVQELSAGNTGTRTVIYTCLFLIILGLFQLVYGSLHNYFAGIDKNKTQYYMKEKIMECVCRAPYPYIENKGRFTEKINFIESYSGQRVAGSIQSVITLGQNGIMLVSVIFALGCINWLIVLLLVATCIPAIILAYMQRDEEFRNRVKWMKEGALVPRYFLICCGRECIQEVRQFGAFSYWRSRWKEYSDDFLKIKAAVTKKYVVYNVAADLLRNSVYLVVLAVSAYDIYQNPTAGVGMFMVVLTLSKSLQDTLTKLFVGTIQLNSDLEYIKEFFETMETVEPDEEEQQISFGMEKIEFKNVTFRYPDSERDVLKDVTVTLRPGEKVAIVGENGSGKTTFINLLCGFYTPQEGEVLIGGKRIQDHPKSVRNTISAVFQDFGKYETSIEENITLSDLNRRYEEEDVSRILQRLDGGNMLDESKGGIKEKIGQFSKNSRTFSGGEWQKIAISRALFKESATIMILDEPTAALDPISEAELYENFAELVHGKTTLLISHRLGIAKKVDRILVFCDGEIVEDGTHDQLLHSGGFYSKLYQAQAQWYT